MDFDPDNFEGLEAGDVDIVCSVHPWARGRGVAGQSVLLLCRWQADHSIGERGAIRVEPENVTSVRVAERAGFVQIPLECVTAPANRHDSPLPPTLPKLARFDQGLGVSLPEQIAVHRDAGYDSAKTCNVLTELGCTGVIS